MSNTETDEGKKSRQVAKRDWLNEAGERVPTGSPDVIGVRYTYIPTGESVEYVFGDDTLTRQFAAMGAVTKIGNVVNSIVNADDYDGVENPMIAVKEWLEAAAKGEWREPGEAGPRGPKYDKDVLATALHAELGAAAKGDVASYRVRLDDKSYYAKVRANTKVMARYMAAMAEKGVGAPTADSLA